MSKQKWMVGLLFLLRFLSPGWVQAQDMPLSEILRDGHDWKANPSFQAPKATPGFVAKMGTNHFETRDQKLFRIVDGKAVQISTSVPEPTGIVITKDGSTLYVADASSRYVWTFRINRDGSLGPGDRYGFLRLRANETRSEASAATTDSKGRIYVVAKEGIHVFDPTGRLCGVFTNPCKEPVLNLFFSEKQPDELIIQSKTTEFSRKMLASRK